ncbi:MAG: D-cysteine desulfhydrase family protein [Acidobacteria bacterium]|nr:D-cysteine desulfhydrase family protein [Acidobacteriota bacterium]MBI3427740.1 D-cysteine desulfhydrase family protein [Acidobacteriota bacterium]
MEQPNFAEAIARLNAIPRLQYGYYPTPLEELPRLRAALGAGAPRLFVKRDDYSGPGFGGNKVRKLEYVLARAQADGADMAITIGGEKSNHARVTAAMCARLGLRCGLVLNAAAVGHEGWEPASLAADRFYGAEIHHVSSRDERRSTMAAVAEQFRAAGKRVVEIPLGASIPLGALGFARAVAEAQAQLESLGIGITHLFHSSSSGGTQAGLVAGCQLFGLDAQVIGVSADDPAEAIALEVATIIAGVGEVLGAPLRGEATVLDQYVGPGYGVDSPESVAALELAARTEGLLLDPVYSAKAMAGLLDWIRQGKLTADDTVLFWHTGGQLALFYRPEAEAVPRA